jgi:CubicO group peptidase (beta-lactamase class C family)
MFMQANRRGFIQLFVIPICVLFNMSLVFAAQTLPENFDQQVDKVLDAFQIPGLAVAVVKEGKVVLARGYGIRELGGRKTNEHTRFPIASNTKVFTATALAILVDDGLIDWDTPVVDYMPSFALSDPYVTAHITVRDLLVHNSGLAMGAGDLLWWPETTYTMDEIIHRLRYVPLVKSFRQAYAYDNVLYGVAGKLVESVSGLSYADFVDRRILKPAGMKDALMNFKGSVKQGNVARPHANIDGKLQVIDAFESEKTSPAGGLQTSAVDMAQWLRVQLAHGEIDKDTRLFSEASSKALWSIVMPLPGKKAACGIEPLASQFGGYALGLNVSDYRGNRTIGHGGGLPGFISDVVMVPGKNLGIAIMTNGQVRAGITILRSQLLDHYLGANGTDWFPLVQKCHEERMAEFAGIKDSVAAKREASPQTIENSRLLGTFRDAWYGDMKISQLKNGSLEMDFLPTPALIGDMEHWHHNSWIVRWRNAPLPPNDVFVTFSLDAEGNVNGATMKPVSPFTDFSYDFKDLNFKPLR